MEVARDEAGTGSSSEAVRAGPKLGGPLLKQLSIDSSAKENIQK